MTQESRGRGRDVLVFKGQDGALVVLAQGRLEGEGLVAWCKRQVGLPYKRKRAS